MAQTRGLAGLQTQAQQRGDGLGLGPIQPGHQGQLAGLVQLLQDRRNLAGALVFPPDGFHHAEPATAIEVEPGTWIHQTSDAAGSAAATSIGGGSAGSSPLSDSVKPPVNWWGSNSPS